MRLRELLGEDWRRLIEHRRPQVFTAHPEALAGLADVAELERRAFSGPERPAAEWVRGATVTFGPLENADERWLRLRDGFAEDLAPFGVDLIDDGSAVLFVGPAGRAAIVPHADRSDLLVFHLSGRKKWRVFHRGGEARAYAEAELDAPLLDATLDAGDVLFLPQGFVHEAVPVAPGPCLSVSFGYRLAPGRTAGPRFADTPLVARARSAGEAAAPALTLRPLRMTEDLATSVAFRRDAERISFGAPCLDVNDYVRHTAERLSKHPDAVALAWLDETPVGQVELGVTQEGAGYVHLMYLRPLARGARLGEALDRWADATLASWGMERAELRVAASNKGALRFYERVGWRRKSAGELILMERPCPAR